MIFSPPLTICPGAVVEIRSFSTDDVQTPAWRQVLKLVVLAGCLGLLPALLLHWNQTCTPMETFPLGKKILPTAVLQHGICVVYVCVCVCVHELTGFVLVIIDVNIVGLHDHEAFTHQSGWSVRKPQSHCLEAK